MKALLMTVALVFVLVACGGGSTKATSTAGASAAGTSQPTTAAATANTVAPATATIMAPTSTTAPTKTPAPTNTPAPTKTPAPTATPKPTSTPTEVPPTATATPTPEPKIYDGSGDNVVDIQKPDPSTPAAVAYITGNADSGFFAVIGFDDTGAQTDLFVNTTDPYEGLVAIDFESGSETTRLQVKADGDWHIELRPLASMRRISAPGDATGTGDDIFIVSGTLDTAHVTGNASSGFFAVLGWGKNRQLLVNTTDPYDGTVIVAKDTQVIEVRSSDAWTISFK